MGPEDRSNDVLLAGILGRFDAEEKDELGTELAEVLQLELGQDFVPQVTRRLGRELTPVERFRVDTLFRAQRYAGESEEEEEEE